MDPIPREQPHLDRGKYQPLEVIEVPAFTIALCSPDTVNEIGRDSGLPVQAGALTHGPSRTIYLRWPPIATYITVNGVRTINPKYEYGMDMASIERALGYELLSNLLHRDYDPRGR